jgi:hypothetical protein
VYFLITTYLNYPRVESKSNTRKIKQKDFDFFFGITKSDNRVLQGWAKNATSHKIKNIVPSKI